MQKSDATRERLEFSIPEGILLTTHDHALLTKNFRALALEYKGRAQRAKNELATQRTANWRRPARPPVFLMKIISNIFDENIF